MVEQPTPIPASAGTRTILPENASARAIESSSYYAQLTNDSTQLSDGKAPRNVDRVCGRPKNRRIFTAVGIALLRFAAGAHGLVTSAPVGNFHNRPARRLLTAASPDPSSQRLAAFAAEVEEYVKPEAYDAYAGDLPISGDGSNNRTVQVGTYFDAVGSTPKQTLYSHDLTMLQSAVEATRAYPALHINSRHISTGSDGSPKVNVDQYIDRGNSSELLPAPQNALASAEEILASYSDHVAKTLERALQNNASDTWLFISAHGNSWNEIYGDKNQAALNSKTLFKAIDAGVRTHSAAYPQDAMRRINGMILNVCGADTVDNHAALAGVGVEKLVATGVFATDFPMSVLAMLTRNATNKEFARAIVSTVQPGNSGHANTEINVENVSSDRGIIEYRLATTVVQEIHAAIARDPAQNATIIAAVKDVPSALQPDPGSSEEAWPVGDEVYKPGIALYNALASDSAVASNVREAARRASAAFNHTLAASAVNDDANAGGVRNHDLHHQIGAAVAFADTYPQVNMTTILGLDADRNYGFLFPPPGAYHAEPENP